MTFLRSLSRVQRAWLSAGILLVVIGTMVTMFLASPLREIVTSPSAARDRIQLFGVAGPLVMLTLRVLEVLAAIIPGQALDLINGYVFGWWGVPLSILGMALGSMLAIFLARSFGRPLVELFIFSKKGMPKVQTQRRRVWPFFVLFLIPGIPDDLVCYALGLTSIPYKRSVLAAVIGRTPVLVATVAVGATGRNINRWTVGAFVVLVLVCLGLVWWRWKRIKRLVRQRKHEILPGA